jgi:hypothetical protein
MNVGTFLLSMLVLALVGIISVWPQSRGRGYGTRGIVGVVLRPEINAS